MTKRNFEGTGAARNIGAAMAVLAGLWSIPATAQATDRTAMVSVSAPPAASQVHRKMPGQIMDLHHRWIIPGDQYPWSAIGRLSSSAGYCSGAMIGRRLALTAAHCLWNRTTGKRVPAGSLRFAVGYRDGRFLATATVQRVHVAPGFDGAAEYTSQQAVNDWAILELNKDIGKISGHLGVERFGEQAARDAASNGLGFDRAGFGFEHRAVALSRSECGMTGTGDAGQIIHDCYTVKGDSGSPIFHKVGDEFRIVGVAVYSHVYTGSILGGAVATEAFVGLATKLGASSRYGHGGIMRVAAR